MYKKLLLISILFLSINQIAEAKLPQKIQNTKKIQKINNFEVANKLYNERQFDEALVFYEKALITNKNKANIIYESIGDIYSVNNRFNKALENYKKALKLNKKLETRSNYFNALSQLGYYDDVIKNIETLKKDDIRFLDYLILGQVYRELGDKDKAIESFVNSLNKVNKIDEKAKITPTKEEFIERLNIYLAMLYLKKENYNESLKYVDKVLEVNKEVKYAYILKLQLNFLKENYEEVKKIAIEFKKIDAENEVSDLFTNVADNYISKNQENYLQSNLNLLFYFMKSFNDNKDNLFFSKKLAENIYKNNKNKDILVYLGYIEQLNLNFDKALEYYNIAKETEINDANIYYNSAFVYFLKNDIKATIENIKKSSELTDNKNFTNTLLASFYYLLDDDKEVSNYVKKIDLKVSNSSLINKLLEIISKKSDFNKILITAYLKGIAGDKKVYTSDIEKLLKNYPNDPKIYYELGDFYYLANNLELSEFYYEKYLSKNPNDIKVLSNLSKLYKSHSQYKEAKIYLNKIISMDKKNIEANSLFGDILLIEGSDLQKALNYYLRSVELGSENLSDFVNLGYCYLKNDDFNNCIKYSEKSLKLGKDASAYNNLGYCYDMKNNNKKAEEFYLESLKLDPNFDKAKSNLMNLYLRTDPSKLFSEEK